MKICRVCALKKTKEIPKASSSRSIMIFSRRLTFKLARLSLVSASVIIFTITTITVQANMSTANTNDKMLTNGFNRKSIVFDMKTPKVFYCPQEKQLDSSKVIVKAKPLDKLCEFGGKLKPKNKLTDCYNDIDETDFACDEKKRFMLRLDLSSELDSPMENVGDLDYVLTKSSNKKKSPLDGKKY